MRKTIRLFSLAIAGVLASSPTWAANLESPAHQAVVSGIGFIGGWKCDASNITVTIDGGEHIPVAMGQPRADTQPICGKINNGFIQQINWALVGDGEHEAVAYDNGVEFSRSTFTVGSTGEEFLKGAETTRLLENFPGLEKARSLEWNESTQHFEIRGCWRTRMAGGYDRDWWQQYNIDLAAGTYRTEEFLYAEAPDVENCRGGVLTEGAKNRALAAASQIRALHGLPSLQYSSRYDQRMQAASLIQAAAGYPGHYPEPSAQCYTADGAAGSTGSNLTGWSDGYLGSRDPAGNMVGWTDDGRNRNLVAAVGHRRWVLNPFTTYFAYGQVYGYAAQKVFRFDEEPLILPRFRLILSPFHMKPTLSIL